MSETMLVDGHEVAILTNHASPYFTKKQELEKLRASYTEAAEQTRKAIALVGPP